MTETQITETLLAHISETQWPAISESLNFSVKLRSAGKRGADFFHARESTGNRVKIEFYVSPYLPTGKKNPLFMFAALEACRAANEILRGLTHAIAVGE